MIRVGNAEYARRNGTVGLTTMRDRHVDVSPATLRFEFPGKGGRRHVIDLSDRRLARIVRRCQELPGQELFQYVLDDYRRAFGEDKAPKPGGIAVLTDADDTRSTAAGDYANFRACRR